MTSGRLSAFLRESWLGIVALPLWVALAWVLHIGAHLVALWWFGGSLAGFEVGPSQETFGFGKLLYENLHPDHMPGVVLAPVPALALWLSVANLATSFVGKLWVQRLLFWTGFVAPMIELSLLFGGLFQQVARSDTFRTLHGVEVTAAVACGVYAAWAGEMGLRMVRRAYTTQLTGAEYGALFALILGLPWFRYLL